MPLSPRRVLLIENNLLVLRTLSRALRQAGYEVLRAETIDTAKMMIGNEIYHLAIVDINMENDEDIDSGDSGFVLARLLPPWVPCVIHTGYDTPDNILKALHMRAEDVITKSDPQGTQKLLARLDALFLEKVRINLDLRITGQTNLNIIANQIELSPTIPAQAVTGQDVQTILQRLFLEASSIHLTPLLEPEAAPTASLSGAVVLKVQETRHGQPTVSFVLKLGACPEIQTEAENGRKLWPFAGTQRLAHLEGDAYSRHIGGLLMSLIGAHDWQSIQTLAKFIQQRSGGDTATLLERFFTQTFANIYRHAPTAALNLTEYYTEQLRLTPDKLRAAIQKLRPSDWPDPTLHFPGLTGEFPNPVLWALPDGQFRDFGSLQTHVCTIHGDLHTRNLLVDQAGECWMVDFAAVSNEGHILRDLAELESDIKFYALQITDLRLLYALEICLLTPTTWQQPLTPPADPALQQAFTVLNTLRQTAGQLINLDNNMQEYYQALFWHALKMLRLKSVNDEHKRYALLSAALISRRLTDWPRWTPLPDAARSTPTSSLRTLAVVGSLITLLTGLIWGLAYFLVPSIATITATFVFLFMIIVVTFVLQGLIPGKQAIQALAEIVERMLY